MPQKLQETEVRFHDAQAELEEEQERLYVLQEKHSQLQEELTRCKARMADYERGYQLQDAVREVGLCRTEKKGHVVCAGVMPFL